VAANTTTTRNDITYIKGTKIHLFKRAVFSAKTAITVAVASTPV
jgi:hypothetical protein